MSAKGIFTLLGVAALTGIAGLYAIDEFLGPSYAERQRRTRAQRMKSVPEVAQMESVQEPDSPTETSPYTVPDFNAENTSTQNEDTSSSFNKINDSSRRDISSVDGNDKSEVIFEFADEGRSEDDTIKEE